MVNVPLLEVTAPVTLPAPLQLPPVTPSVLESVPLVRLIVLGWTPFSNQQELK